MVPIPMHTPARFLTAFLERHTKFVGAESSA